MVGFFWNNLSWFVLVGMLIVCVLIAVIWKLYKSLPEKEKTLATNKKAPEMVDLSKLDDLESKVQEYRAAYNRIGAFLDNLKKQNTNTIQEERKG